MPRRKAQPTETPGPAPAETSQPAFAGPSVIHRLDAIPNPAMVNCTQSSVSQEEETSKGRRATVPRSRLGLQAWVSNISYEKDVFVDLAFLDTGGGVIHSDTLRLEHESPAPGDGDFFRLDSPIPPPESGPPPPEAKSVQYRLYYQVRGTTFTDDLLHEHELPAAPEGGRRGRIAPASG